MCEKMRCPGLAIGLIVVFLLLALPCESKKGVAVSGLYNCNDTNFLEVEWWWNWSHQPYCQGTSQPEYVPMIWGEPQIGLLSQLPPSSWLLTFNEPNYKSQSNMSPEKAAALWPALEATGRLLVSPGVTLCSLGDLCVYTGFDWLDGFFRACQNCRVDAVAIHVYQCDIGTATWLIQQAYDRYHRPVWVTELACGNGTPEQNLNFMKAILPAIQGMGAVQRYAWVAPRWNYDEWAKGGALLTADTNSMSLTQCGQYFKPFAR
eukprot:TRINITY_DN7125_c0_g1_i4.p1 TRINITY_DN7125_c0_g1~~TRINITY_DN7125_c0_g1_i4.p1  ORF type:complete len:262 (+),score=39.26 TRINITY_DN7125_c0_g1_i4:107-892(+)